MRRFKKAVTVSDTAIPTRWSDAGDVAVSPIIDLLEENYSRRRHDLYTLMSKGLDYKQTGDAYTLATMIDYSIVIVPENMTDADELAALTLAVADDINVCVQIVTNAAAAVVFALANNFQWVRVTSEADALTVQAAGLYAMAEYSGTRFSADGLMVDTDNITSYAAAATIVGYIHDDYEEPWFVLGYNGTATDDEIWVRSMLINANAAAKVDAIGNDRPTPLEAPKLFMGEEMLDVDDDAGELIFSLDIGKLYTDIDGSYMLVKNEFARIVSHGLSSDLGVKVATSTTPDLLGYNHIDYTDDFASLDAGWTEITGSAGLSIVSGELQADQFTSAYYDVTPAESFQYSSIKATIMHATTAAGLFVYGSTTGSGGLIDDCYYAVADPVANWISLYKRVGGSATPVNSGVSIPVAQGDVLEIYAQDGYITVLLNDEEVIYENDDDLDGGVAGVISLWGSALLDDATVTYLGDDYTFDPIDYNNDMQLDRYVVFVTDDTGDLELNFITSGDGDSVEYLITRGMVNPLPEWMDWRVDTDSDAWQFTNIAGESLTLFKEAINQVRWAVIPSFPVSEVAGIGWSEIIGYDYYPEIGTITDDDSNPVPQASSLYEFMLADGPSYILIDDAIIFNYDNGTDRINLWGPLDEWGLMLSLPRHDGEGLIRYQLRLMDVFEHQLGTPQEALIYAIIRELSPYGIDEDTFATLE